MQNAMCTASVGERGKGVRWDPKHMAWSHTQFKTAVLGAQQPSINRVAGCYAADTGCEQAPTGSQQGLRACSGCPVGTRAPHETRSTQAQLTSATLTMSLTSHRSGVRLIPLRPYSSASSSCSNRQGKLSFRAVPLL